MRISNLRVRDIENRWESLSLCLQAVARWAGVELHFRSINAALGLSFMISAPRDETVSLSWWMAFGRDAFLIDAGKLFGLKIRRLDLPEAVAAAPDSPEAFQEFEATVKPMITEALGSNLPVLAWQGWPDYHRYLWGVITDEHSSELGLAGTTMWAGGKVMPLTAPPVRLYVVDEVKQRQPDGDELLCFAVSNTKQVVHDGLAPEYGVVTGLPAYDRWIKWLADDPEKHNSEDRGPSCHYQMARFVTYNRESACRFVDHYKDGLHEEVHPFLEAMLADCRGVINALATARDLNAVEVLYASADGRDALAAGVHAARDFLEAQIKTIDHLAEMLGV